jgi:hypothetical protein
MQIEEDEEAKTRRGKILLMWRRAKEENGCVVITRGKPLRHGMKSLEQCALPRLLALLRHEDPEVP